MENLENLRIIVNAWCIGSVVGFNYVCLPAESLSEVVLLPTVGVDVYGQSQPGYHRISHVMFMFFGELATDSPSYNSDRDVSLLSEYGSKPQHPALHSSQQLICI